MKDQRLQCPWTHPAIMRLLIERSAYERSGRPAATVTAANIEAELAEVARLRRKVAP